MAKDHTPSNPNIFTQDFALAVLVAVIAFSGFTYVLYVLPGIPPTPPCPEPPAPAPSVEGILRYGLIATHLLSFVLIPLCMQVFYDGLPRLGVLPRAIFFSQLGLGLAMVAIAAEIGWHVMQDWYYINQFTSLNFLFYFFLISAFALWADGLLKRTSRKTQMIDLGFAIVLVVMSVLYVLGARQGNDSFKIPIYIGLTFVFTVLTWRGWKLLQDWRIIFFPILGVGVNLTFIFLLDAKGSCDPITNDLHIIANALFHISHDLFGTLASIAFLTWLMYVNTKDKPDRLNR